MKSIEATPNLLTACVLTQNNARTIGMVVDQLLTIAEEVILIDGGSDDDTVNIARQRPGVKVVERQFDGNFARQRNHVFDHARGRWILMLDSDELLGPSALKWIPRLVHLPLFSWFNFSRCWVVDIVGQLSYLSEKPYYPDRQRRLFRNNKARFRYDETRPIHEKFAAGYRGLGWHIKSLHILHYDLVLRDRKSREEKARRYQQTDPKFQNANHYYLWEDRKPNTSQLPDNVHWDLRNPKTGDWNNNVVKMEEHK